MQEIKKKMGRETPEQEFHEDDSYYLCLVYGIDQMVPVYLPGSIQADVGDILFFDYNGETLQSSIKFLRRCHINSDIWSAMTVATQMSPIKAMKIARMNTITWNTDD